jgi:outer membrane protein, heavy metal efflux system
MHFPKTGLALATLLYCACSFAAENDRPLSLRDAINATLAQNPQLVSYELRQQALAGEQQTAALKPALQLNGEAENLAGSGTYKGTDSTEFTLALSSVIELGGKRDARLGVITERQQQLAGQRRVAELDLLAEVTRRFIDAAAAQQQLESQRDSLALAGDTVKAVKQRVEAGNTPSAELARAQANQIRQSIALQQAELAFTSARLKLAALWSNEAPGFDNVSADLLKIPSTPSLNDLLAGLPNNPDIALFASEARLREAELRLAQSKAKADLEWTAGVRQLQASGDQALVLGLKVPLAGERRATGEIATARANQQLVESERELALRQLRAQLVGLYQEREGARLEVNGLREQVIPQLKQALAGTRSAFNNGRYGYLELASAQQELLQAETALIAVAAKTHQLQTEIERLSGSPLVPAGEVTP